MKASLNTLRLALLVLLSSTGCAPAPDPLRVAVAANFRDTFDALVQRYQVESSLRIEVAYAATGILYAQIVNGAPFDVFLAADRLRPEQLETRGDGVSGSRVTYAFGQLALWVPGADRAPGENWLRNYGGRLAIANPELAPYGIAARAVLQRFNPGLLDGRLVLGSSVNQATHYVASGGVAAGLLAFPTLRDRPSKELWRIPERHYPAIEQQAIALTGPRQRAGQAFVDFLTSDAARQVIAAAGYRVPARVPATDLASDPDQVAAEQRMSDR
jgi:molybdate transport system substrate-binding protein